MVDVGDKVIVTPLYGQKDNLAVISAGGGGGITEGDYNTWTWKWTKTPDNEISSLDEIDISIDEKNELLKIVYVDDSYNNRFGIYNISDFSVVYESSIGSDYTRGSPNSLYSSSKTQGYCCFYSGGFSVSQQTYLLLLRNDRDTIEVWREGASALWSANTQTDYGQTSECDGGGISLTGKYIIIGIYLKTSPYTRSLMLYEGSKV